MKEEYKEAITQSVPYLIVIIVIFLALYLNALIKQDTITLKMAQILGYVLLSCLIAMEIVSLVWIKIGEIEGAKKDTKIEELEKELEQMKKEKF